MSVDSAWARVRAALDPWPVRWRTVVGMAVLMAYADGFWLTSVTGAVGAIERTQSPFVTWLRDSTLMVPAFALAVLVALALAHRRFGRPIRGRRGGLAATLLIAAAGTVLAFAQVMISAVYDYHLQAGLLQFMQSVHAHGTLADQLQLNRAADMQGARYATALDLISNCVLVGWVLALQGGRLEQPEHGGGRRRSPTPAAEVVRR